MKYLRRLIWYIAVRLTVITLVLSLMVTVFYYAMNMSNMYVVLKDGMARRAQVAMMTEEVSELNKYFSQRFMDTDAVVQAVRQGTSPYADYNIRGIDHRLQMGFAWVWPWETMATVTITEEIPRIDGRAKGNTAEALVAAQGSDALYPPSWTGARYRVVMQKDSGQWRIQSLTKLEN